MKQEISKLKIALKEVHAQDMELKKTVKSLTADLEDIKAQMSGPKDLSQVQKLNSSLEEKTRGLRKEHA